MCADVAGARDFDYKHVSCCLRLCVVAYQGNAVIISFLQKSSRLANARFYELIIRRKSEYSSAPRHPGR